MSDKPHLCDEQTIDEEGREICSCGFGYGYALACIEDIVKAKTLTQAVGIANLAIKEIFEFRKKKSDQSQPVQ